MKNIVRTALISALLFTALPAVHSAEAASESKEQLAREYVEVTLFRQRLVGEVTKNIGKVLKEKLSHNSHIGPDKLKEIELAVISHVKSHSDELTDIMGEVYASNFTKDELKQMVAYRKTPAGQKETALASTISNESRLAGRKWGQTIMPAFIPKLVEILQ